MATIMTLHIARNAAPAAGQDCPGMRIQVIDIVQPPGMGMFAIDAIEAHQCVVTTTLAANSKAAAPMKGRSLSRATSVRSEKAAPAVAPGVRAMIRLPSQRVEGLWPKLVAHNARVGVTNLTGMAWTR